MIPMNIQFLEHVLSSCPAGYDLIRDGECRGFQGTISATFAQAVLNVTDTCTAIQGKPVIIRNDEVGLFLQATMIVFFSTNHTGRRWRLRRTRDTWLLVRWGTFPTHLIIYLYLQTRHQHSEYFLEGLVCNSTTKRWDWADGSLASSADFRPTDGYDDGTFSILKYRLYVYFYSVRSILRLRI